MRLLQQFRVERVGKEHSKESMSPTRARWRRGQDCVIQEVENPRGRGSRFPFGTCCVEGACGMHRQKCSAPSAESPRHWYGGEGGFLELRRKFKSHPSTGRLPGKQ